MNPTVRQQILEALGDLSAACPDVRFGQLVANLSYQAAGHTSEAIWDASDEELLAAAKRLLAQRSAQAAPLSGAS